MAGRELPGREWSYGDLQGTGQGPDPTQPCPVLSGHAVEVISVRETAQEQGMVEPGRERSHKRGRDSAQGTQDAATGLTLTSLPLGTWKHAGIGGRLFALGSF
jgi:hypothetical protein